MHVWLYACMDVCMHVLPLSLSLPICISLHQHVAQTQTPFLTSKTSARQRSQLAFRVDFEVAIYVLHVPIPRWSPKCLGFMMNIPFNYLHYVHPCIIMNTVSYRVLYRVLLWLNGIDPQQVTCYIRASTASHWSPARSDTRISRCCWRCACTPSNEHLLSTARHDGWCLARRAAAVSRKKKPIPLTVIFYFMKGIESLTTI